MTESASEVLPTIRPVRVVHQGVERDVLVFDNHKRPPDPEGRWLDDLVAEACRRDFGCSSGSCRPLQGRTGVLEFREYWEEPCAGKVARRVPVTKEPGGVTVGLVVSCRAMPGCDEEAVILAEAQLACERRWGQGVAGWTPNRPSHITFRAGPPEFSFLCEVPCRYTVLRSGVATEVVVPVPRIVVDNWAAIKYALAKHCSEKFGPGRLSYEPHLGETYFSWSQ